MRYRRIILRHRLGSNMLTPAVIVDSDISVALKCMRMHKIYANM